MFFFAPLVPEPLNKSSFRSYWSVAAIVLSEKSSKDEGIWSSVWSNGSKII